MIFRRRAGIGKPSAGRTVTLVSIHLLAWTVACCAHATQVDPTEQRLGTLTKLIEQSSAAQMIASSGSRAAREHYDNARQSLKNARQALRYGDEPAAKRHLGAAFTDMMTATRLGKRPQASPGDSTHAFETRLASLEALSKAYVRIRSETDEVAIDDELIIQVREGLATARHLRDQGAVSDAVDVLDATYVATKRAIDQLRGGQTLVRTLTFDSPADEYAYEVDRNSTHRMLIDILLKDRITSDPSLAAPISARVEAAARLRAEAERSAQSSNYISALESIEASTLELVHAIRGAGIYIPR